MTPGDRVLRIEGLSFRIVSAPDVRARDIASHALTIRREDDGSVMTIDAATFLGDASAGDGPPRSSRPYRLRELIERLIELDFDDQWVETIVRQVKAHRLLEIATDGGAT